MGCCGGGSSAGNREQSSLLIDQAAAAGTVTKLVYICETRQTQAFTLSGRVYQFGNNDRRRVNAVDARLVPNFLAEDGRFFGCFAAFDETVYNKDGTLIGSLVD